MRHAPAILMTAVLLCLPSNLRAESGKTLDDELAAALKANGFTGRIEAKFKEDRPSRPARPAGASEEPRSQQRAEWSADDDIPISLSQEVRSWAE